MKRAALFLPVLLVLSLLLSACSLSKTSNDPRWLVLAVDNKLVESGLVAALVSPFESANQVRVKVLPVDPSTALKYARNGGVDILLTSGADELVSLAGPAPEIPPYSDKPQPTPTLALQPTPTPTALSFEIPFAERKIALWSQLVLVGPPNDSLGTAGRSSLAKVFQNLAQNNATIIVAGRESGTNQQMERLWSQVGLYNAKDRGSGYRVIDGDAAEALKQAEQNGGYSVVNLDVFINNHNPLKSKILYDKDLSMFVSYELSIRNYLSIPGQDINLSRNFVNYLLSSPTQDLIARFSKDRVTRSFYQPYYYPVYFPR